MGVLSPDDQSPADVTHPFAFFSRPSSEVGGFLLPGYFVKLYTKLYTSLLFQEKRGYGKLHNPLICLARLAGFEPAAYCLEGSCSIRLSYRRITGRYRKISGKNWSGREDSASIRRLLAPHSSRAASLPAASMRPHPRTCSARGGFRIL